MNIDKIKADAEAALPGASPDDQYRADRQHVFNCDPDTILKMIAVIESAREICAIYHEGGFSLLALHELDGALNALETT